MNDIVNKEEAPYLPMPAEVPELFPELMNLDKPHAFVRFAEWYATPEALRKPNRQKHVAKMLRVGEDTLSEWKHHHSSLFFSVVAYFLKQWGRSKTPNVIMALYRTAVKFGNAAEVKLWQQLIEDYREKSEVETKNVNVNYVITRGENKKSSKEGDRPVPGTIDPVAPESLGIVESVPVQDTGGGTEGQEDDI